MGEAKRRAARMAEGLSFRPARLCPECKSPRVDRLVLASGMTHIETPHDACRQCGTIWEAYPANWVEDVVAAEPCDNCAFRPGAPEHDDPAAWNALLEQLKAGGEFRCHKGCPITGMIYPGPGRPSYVGRTLGFDLKWMNSRARMCAGFIRVLWAWQRKGHDWLSQRYPEAFRDRP
jgi:hypothetical protein